MSRVNGQLVTCERLRSLEQLDFSKIPMPKVKRPKSGEEVSNMGEYEIIRKSKVTEYIQTGQEFFICDMSRKKVYSSNDLRLSDLAEKLDRDDTFIFKEV